MALPAVADQSRPCPGRQGAPLLVRALGGYQGHWDRQLRHRCFAAVLGHWRGCDGVVDRTVWCGQTDRMEKGGRGARHAVQLMNLSPMARARVPARCRSRF
jgi:hypothetical protein